MGVVRSAAGALLVVLLSVLAVAHSPPAGAGQSSIRIGGGLFSIPVISLRETKFKSVIQQQFDFSCGSAALATLLSYHYGRSTTESQTFEKMFEVGDQKAIKRSGFSLLDMKNYLKTIGLQSDGFRITLDELADVGVAGVVLINLKGYKHFVVIKGLESGDVLIGDPAFGASVYSREEFEAVWEGVILVIRDDLQLAQTNFNLAEEWQIRTRAPTTDGIGRQGLSSFVLRLPQRNDF